MMSFLFFTEPKSANELFPTEVFESTML